VLVTLLAISTIVNVWQHDCVTARRSSTFRTPRRCQGVARLRLSTLDGPTAPGVPEAQDLSAVVSSSSVVSSSRVWPGQ